MVKCLFIIVVVFFNFSFAKDISLEVLAKKTDVTIDMNEESLLQLNGYRQAITSELLGLELNSELFWSKLDQKKMITKDEYLFLQSFFNNVSLVQNPKAPQVVGDKVESVDENRLTGNFKAAIDLEKLKSAFYEITSEKNVMRDKTFYLFANIEIDPNMSWTDLGVQTAELFRDAVFDSWKKFFEKEVKGFEKIILLKKDLVDKPDFMNNKSLTLKWNSTFRKIAINNEDHTASYELSTHFILQNSKMGTILLAYDFPILKKSFDTQNKKALSSSLASLVYNLIPAQFAKINSILEANAVTIEPGVLEVKIISKMGLMEIMQINSLLEDTFKDIKLTSQLKSYAADGSTLVIKAGIDAEKILDNLSTSFLKFSLNEQKVLLFNRADKTFAILPKGPNN